MNASTSIRRAIPADAAVSVWRAPDGWALRRFDWPGRGRGSILFQCGRADVFEKYLETFGFWHAEGWSVTSLDWRGQGGSGRLSADARVGHVDTFGHWVSDLGAFWPAWAGASPGPHIAMGHSMGGHLLLQAMLERAIRPDAAVLVAPMTGLRGPIGARWAERVVRFMRSRGDPARAAWKAGERPGPKHERQTILTSDRSRYEDEQWWYEQDPDIKLGPPSWSWLAEAYTSTRIQRGDPRIATLAVPILMLVAEADELVDAEASVEIARRLPDAELLRFGRESAHEILRESDEVRDRALAAIRSFLDARAPAR